MTTKEKPADAPEEPELVYTTDSSRKRFSPRMIHRTDCYCLSSQVKQGRARDYPRVDINVINLNTFGLLTWRYCQICCPGQTVTS